MRAASAEALAGIACDGALLRRFAGANAMPEVNEEWRTAAKANKLVLADEIWTCVPLEINGNFILSALLHDKRPQRIVTERIRPFPSAFVGKVVAKPPHVWAFSGTAFDANSLVSCRHAKRQQKCAICDPSDLPRPPAHYYCFD